MDELLKQRLIWAALGFNFTLILFQLIFNGMVWGQFSVLKTFIGVAVAAVAGGAGYFAAQMTQK